MDESINDCSPYTILDISINSSPIEIKNAFNKLALKYHPDKNKDPNSYIIFEKIYKAYKTLTNIVNNNIYNMCGNMNTTDYILDILNKYIGFDTSRQNVFIFKDTNDIINIFIPHDIYILSSTDNIVPNNILKVPLKYNIIIY